MLVKMLKIMDIVPKIFTANFLIRMPLCLGD